MEHNQKEVKKSKQALANKLFSKGLSNKDVQVELSKKHSPTSLALVHKMRCKYKGRFKSELAQEIKANTQAQKVLTKVFSDEENYQLLKDMLNNLKQELFLK